MSATGAGVLYYGAAWLGLRMAVFPETASPIWPAAGVAIAALTLLDLRAWPAIAVAAFLAELPAFGPGPAALLALGNTSEALIGAFFLRRLGGADAFTRRDGVAFYLLGVAVACLPSTLAALGPLESSGGPTPLPQLATTWFLGDLMGATLVAPPLVLLARPKGAVRRSPLEWGGFVAVAAAVAFIAFYPWRSGNWSDFRLGFLTIGPLVWAASRMGPPTTAWTALVMTLSAQAGLAAGTLDLAAERNAALLQMQMLAGVLTVLGLYLAATVHERNSTISRLEQSARLKTGFLNKAAHDLRTPLTPLRIQLHTLRPSVAGHEKGKQAIALLERNVDRLDRIVARMLQAATAGEAADRLKPHATELESLRQAIQSHSRPADGPTLVCKAGHGVVHIDQVVVMKAVAELLDNALRFARSKVEVDLRRTLTGGCRITVTDDGPGIDPGALERSLEPFAHRQTADDVEGSGLGLYIARTLIDGHGGRMSTETPDEGGTRFILDLPRPLSA